jgi:hypothetical protein
MTSDPSPQPMTAEDVVRRIASECAFVDPHGGVGIRLKPAAAIVRQCAVTPWAVASCWRRALFAVAQPAQESHPDLELAADLVDVG